MNCNRWNRFKLAQLGYFLKKLPFFVLLFWSAISFGAERPSIRVLTFTGDNAWQGIQTIYRPTPDGFYKTEKIESTFRLSNDGCDDLLGQHQKRALEVMLKNRYITENIYNALRAQRVHDMRKYILATLFIDLPEAETLRRGIPQERQMEHFQAESGEFMVRIHEGSLFVVRGYDIQRSGVDSFSIKPLNLPWEIGQIPTTLKSTLDRTHLPAAVEFGRALVEDGSPRDYFPLLMKTIVSALAADLRILGLDPANVPAMAHAYDPEHARLFSHMFSARPMTPEMQQELEANPAAFLASVKKLPLPKKDEWSRYDDTVVIGSVQSLIDQYPIDSISAFSHELKQILPSYVTAEQRQTVILELASAHREDYDFTWHDEHRPGQRKPIQVRDYGTGLFLLKILHAAQKASIAVTDQMMSQIIGLITKNSLHVDPDFSQGEWIEKEIFVPLPPYQTAQGEPIPGITVSNLDPNVPSSEVENYLGKILVSLAETINSDLKNLSAHDQQFLLEEMNKTRARRGLASISFVNLSAFLETYDFVFATSDERLATRIKMLGGTITKGITIANRFSSGKIDLKIDPTKIGIAPEEFFKNPQKYQGRIQRYLQELLNKNPLSIFQPTTVYRFQIEEVEEHAAALGPAAAHSLAPSYHRQKLLRYFITYQ
jgi:hypothetical protein